MVVIRIVPDVKRGLRRGRREKVPMRLRVWTIAGKEGVMKSRKGAGLKCRPRSPSRQVAESD